MRNRSRQYLAAAALMAAVSAMSDEPGTSPTDRSHVVLLESSGVIGPASADFIVRGLRRAEDSGAAAVILRMDTPGGLDTAMRQIIQAILSSNVPVVTWVAPRGARAASAGTYILYASHVAAMAPATNVGAATPVQLKPPALPDAPKKDPKGGDGEADDKDATTGDPMERKIVNDAAAYIRGLALMRERNAEWAERAVREAASLTAEDALAEGVIEIIAEDVNDLLEQLDSRTVKFGAESRTLSTRDIDVQTIEQDWRHRVLAIITNPNVAYVLMLLGVYGLFFELSNPGNILPGVAGTVCLLLALYAFNVLPVNYAGVALILLGAAFMAAEVFVSSFGALGIGGGIAFVIGSLILMDTEVEGFTLSLPLVLFLAATSALFFMAIVTLAVRQRRRPVVTGSEEMVGSTGVALASFASNGVVRIHGELWTAKTSQPVQQGQAIRVCAIDGLTLDIEPLTEED